MKISRFIPVITVMGIIYYFSSLPGEALDLPDIPDIDKLLHSLAYAVLALSAAYAVPPRYLDRHPVKAAVLIVLFTIVYGLSDEFHQSFTPNRTPSALDLAADTLGALIAVAGLSLVRQWIQKRQQEKSARKAQQSL
jgi:VanZ family protein